MKMYAKSRQATAGDRHRVKVDIAGPITVYWRSEEGRWHRVAWFTSRFHLLDYTRGRPWDPDASALAAKADELADELEAGRAAWFDGFQRRSVG